MIKIKVKCLDDEGGDFEFMTELPFKPEIGYEFKFWCNGDEHYSSINSIDIKLDINNKFMYLICYIDLF